MHSVQWGAAAAARADLHIGLIGPEAPAEFDPGVVTAMLDTLERLGIGSVLLDPSFQIVEYNQAGHSLLARAQSFTGAPSLQGSARQLVQRARQGAGRTGTWTTWPSTTKWPIAVNWQSLPTYGGDYTLLILVELVRTPDYNPATLRHLFGLTAIEAEVAVQLAKGQTLADIARSRSVSVATVRVQLTSIFQKTHTRRQTELAILVGRLAVLP